MFGKFHLPFGKTNKIFQEKFKIKKLVQKIWAFFIDLIFPVECLGCNFEGEWVCSECLFKIKNKKIQLCPLCYKESFLGTCCRHCISKTFLDGVIVIGEYQDKLMQKIIRTFKYKFVKDLSNYIADIIIRYLKIAREFYRINHNKHIPLFENSRELLIIPVPLYHKRILWRGFNQAEEIAIPITKYLEAKIILDLKRIRNTKPQVKLSEEQRRCNVKDCFLWQGERIDGKNVVLIDDVITTGSTLEECAKELKRVGARSVWAIVAARN